MTILNHTHPPLWATSFLREVNLDTAYGCEVFCWTWIPRSSRGMTADLFFMDCRVDLAVSSQ